MRRGYGIGLLFAEWYALFVGFAPRQPMFHFPSNRMQTPPVECKATTLLRTLEQITLSRATGNSLRFCGNSASIRSSGAEVAGQRLTRIPGLRVSCTEEVNDHETS